MINKSRFNDCRSGTSLYFQDCHSFQIVDCDIINNGGCGVVIEESVLKKRRLIKE